MGNDLAFAIKEIQKLAQGKDLFLVAIDGRGGSGKSTIAEKIKQQLENVQIVPMDAFYLLSINRVLYPNIPIDPDRLCHQVLEPLQHRKNAIYAEYSAAKNTMVAQHTVIPQGIILIEGWFSLHQKFLPYYNYTIWKEEDKIICLERGVQREVSKGRNREKLMARWQKYQKIEGAYIATYQPQKNADIVIKDF